MDNYEIVNLMRRVNLIKRIQDSAIGLSNRIRELKEEEEFDMWDEILDYLKEKRELQENG